MDSDRKQGRRNTVPAYIKDVKTSLTVIQAKNVENIPGQFLAGADFPGEPRTLNGSGRTRKERSLHLGRQPISL